MAKVSEIPAGSNFRGEVHFNSQLNIFGSVEGNIQSGGKLKVEKGGSFQGDVKAQEIEITGKLQGNALDCDLVHITNTGKFLGDIECKKLQIDKGGSHNGTTVMPNA